MPSQVFTVTGTWNWPPGVTVVTAEALGGGGAGGAATGNPATGGGGKGASYARAVVTKGAETFLSVQVATAATGGGGSSWVTQGGTQRMLASGGSAGATAATAINGVGSSTPNGTSQGTTINAGGNGGTGNFTLSGAGGGAGGPTSLGGNASVGTGGTPGTGTWLNGLVYGVSGAAGVAVRTNGNNGSPYGAGGSGGNTNQNTDRPGGSGGPGIVLLTWEGPLVPIKLNAVIGCLVFLLLAVPAHAQTVLFGDKVVIGTTTPTTSPMTVQGLPASTGTTTPLQVDANGLVSKGPVTFTIPSTYTQRNVAETIGTAWTFSGNLNVNGILYGTTFSGSAGNFTTGSISNALTVGGGITVSGGLATLNNGATVYQGINMVSGDLTMSAGTNRVLWAAAGVGPPSYTTRSAGTKMVLYPLVGAQTADYALGIESGHLWFSQPDPTSGGFKWYGGTTNLMTLDVSARLVLPTGGKFINNMVEIGGDSATSPGKAWIRGNGLNHLVINGPTGGVLYLGLDSGSSTWVNGSTFSAGGGFSTSALTSSTGVFNGVVQANSNLTVAGTLTASSTLNVGGQTNMQTFSNPSLVIWNSDNSANPGKPYIRSAPGTHMVFNAYGTMYLNWDTPGQVNFGSSASVGSSLAVGTSASFGTTINVGGVATVGAMYNSGYIDQHGRIIMRDRQEIRFHDDTTNRGIYFAYAGGGGYGLGGTAAWGNAHANGSGYYMRIRAHSGESVVFEGDDGAPRFAVRMSDGMMESRHHYPAATSTYNIGDTNWKWAGIALNLQPSGSGPTIITDASGYLYYFSSTRATKKDIVPLTLDHARSVVNRLTPIRYRDIKDTITTSLTRTRGPLLAGLIVEDAMDAGLEELVTWYDFKPASIDYQRLPVYLAVLVKDLQARIEALEKKP